MKHIYILQDEGMSYRGAQFSKWAFTMALQNFEYGIRFITAKEIFDGDTLFHPNTKMLVIGSGTSYTKVKKSLGEQGEENIRRFIQQGGKYCGICLGSIGASKNIRYQAHDGLKTNTGLGLFNMTAMGSLPIVPYYDNTSRTSTIITPQHLRSGITFPALYWGGNGMDRHGLSAIGAEPLSSIILPNGDEKIMSARIQIGQNGGEAFISGYHFEACTRAMLWEWTIQFSDADEHTERMKQEILAHPEKAYLMGLACALDDMKLVEGHSFARDIWPEGFENESELEKPTTIMPQASPLILQ